MFNRSPGIIRIIPKLDIKGPNLVKGVHLEGLRVLGKPEWFAERYYNQGADELVYMDVVASLYGRNSLHGIIERTAAKLFIPMTVGGGIRSLEDIRSVLRSGADKVAINTAAVNRPALLSEAANTFGSSTIVLGVEAAKQPDGSYRVYTDNGRNPTKLEVIEWCKQAADLGVGEVLLTAVEREGTGRGFDVNLLNQVSAAVRVPVIACGGAGKPEDVLEAVEAGGVDAIGIGGMFHYREIVGHQRIAREFVDEGNINFLLAGQNIKSYQLSSISQVKECLVTRGFKSRPVPIVEDQIALTKSK